MAEFAKAIGIILEHEGGSKYTNIPEDSGGPTKWGITLATLARWRGQRTYPGDVQRLTREEACAIYRKGYWDPCHGDEIADQVVATKCFDMAVNLGVERKGTDAAELVQRAVNRCAPLNQVSVDGQIGPQTVEAINLCDPNRLIDALCTEQRDYYLRLIALKPTQGKFRRGWLRRAAWPKEAL